MCFVADICVKFAPRVSEAPKKNQYKCVSCLPLNSSSVARIALLRGRVCLSTVLLLMHVSNLPLKLVKNKYEDEVCSQNPVYMCVMLALKLIVPLLEQHFCEVARTALLSSLPLELVNHNNQYKCVSCQPLN